MVLTFDTTLSENYSSNSQIARVLTENWVEKNIFCPNCGNSLSPYENNRPVADLYCPNCKEDFELKSKKNNMGKKIVDGAYNKMIERLESSQNPNFFFLNYDVRRFQVTNFLVIPNFFFVPDIIEKRKPLSPVAKRAGWIGCNILLESIPSSGKIFYVKGKEPQSKESILGGWSSTIFLRDKKDQNTRGWLLDIMNCIEQIGKTEFVLEDIYSFETILKTKHPENNFIKDKIRQQLQVLRDKDYLEFVGRGTYRMKNAHN